MDQYCTVSTTNMYISFLLGNTHSWHETWQQQLDWRLTTRNQIYRFSFMKDLSYWLCHINMTLYLRQHNYNQMQLNYKDNNVIVLKTTKLGYVDNSQTWWAKTLFKSFLTTVKSSKINLRICFFVMCCHQHGEFDTFRIFH